MVIWWYVYFGFAAGWLLLVSLLVVCLLGDYG